MKVNDGEAVQVHVEVIMIFLPSTILQINSIQLKVSCYK